MTLIEFCFASGLGAVLTVAVFIMVYAVLMERWIQRDSDKLYKALEQLRTALDSAYDPTNEKWDLGESTDKKAS